MDEVFANMQAVFGSKIEFRRLDWEDKAAKGAIEKFSLVNPPASVLAGSKGHVVEKFEGMRDAGTVKIKLSKMIAKSREKAK